MPLPISIKNNIALPIILAPMFLVSNDELVIASCKKGVMAAYPFPNSRTIADLDQWLEKVSERLKKEKEKNEDLKIAPWIANMIVHSTYERFEEELLLIKKYQPQIVITALGSPARVVPTVKEYGGLVFADVSNIAFAQKAIKAGVDGLILLCAGAGGHTGYLNPLAFLREVKKIWNGIIIISGGVNTAKEIKALEYLGADLIYMGTHFIATTESAASDAYKKMITETSIDDILTTNAVTGVQANFIKQTVEKANIDWKQNKPLEKMDFSDRYNDNAPKAWKDIWSAGHGVGDNKSVVDVATKINILHEAYQTL